MRIGELHAIGTQLVKMGCVHIALVTTKCLDITVAKIVSQNEHDIGSLGSHAAVQMHGTTEGYECTNRDVSIECHDGPLC